MPKFKLPRETSTLEMLKILAEARPDLASRYAGDRNYWVFELSSGEAWALEIPLKRSDDYLSLQLVIQNWCDGSDWRWSLKSLDTPGYRAEISLSKDHCLSHEAKYPEQAFLGAYLKVIFAEVPQPKSA